MPPSYCQCDQQVNINNQLLSINSAKSSKINLSVQDETTIREYRPCSQRHNWRKARQGRQTLSHNIRSQTVPLIKGELDKWNSTWLTRTLPKSSKDKGRQLKQETTACRANTKPEYCRHKRNSAKKEGPTKNKISPKGAEIFLSSRGISGEPIELPVTQSKQLSYLTETYSISCRVKGLGKGYQGKTKFSPRPICQTLQGKNRVDN